MPGNGVSAALLKHGLRVGVPTERLQHDQQQMQDLAESFWGVKRSPRGRKSLPDRFCAEIASDYDGLLQAGSRRPAADLAKERGISHGLARAYIKRARDRKYLTHVPTGQQGGSLTPKGKRILSRHASAKGARKGSQAPVLVKG